MIIFTTAYKIKRIDVILVTPILSIFIFDYSAFARVGSE